MNAFARQCLDRLRADRSELPPIGRLNTMVKIPEGEYSPEDVQFLEKYVDSVNLSVQILVLRILCRFGNPVSKYVERVGHNSAIVSEVLDIAERQGDAETIIGYASLGFLKNNIVYRLRRMGKEEYLTAFLFSDDRETANLVMQMEEMKND